MAILGLCLGTAAARAQEPASPTPTVEAEELPDTATTDEIYRSMFGGEAPKLMKLPYPTLIVGINRGQVVVEPGATPETTLVDTQGLLPLVLPFLTAEKAKEIEALGGRPQISLADLNAAGLKTEFDRARLALVIDIPTEVRNRVPIALRPQLNPANALETLKPAEVSGYLNMFAGTSYISQSSAMRTGFDRSSVEVRGAFNVRGFVFESGVSYLSTEDDPFTRTETRLTYDLPKHAVRLQGGDLNSPVSGLQETLEMAGVAVFRDFDIRPYDIVSPTPSQEFQLDRPARVSVYINGQFQRELRLIAGRYRLTDLPLRSAAGNDVELVITYDTGEEQRLVFAAFFDFDLLKPGVSEFAMNLGVASRFDNGRRVYDADNPVISAFYRRGLTDNLTVGANVQADAEVANVGGEVLLATAIGSFGLLSSWNVESAGPSASATTLFYRWNGLDAVQMMTFEILARYAGDDFRTLADPGRATPYEYDISGRFGVNITPATRLQLSAQVRSLRPEDELAQDYSLAVSQRTRFGGFVLSAYYEDSPEREKDFGIRASWTLRLGQGNASASYDGRSDAVRATYNRGPDPGLGGFGYDVGYSRQIDVEELMARGHYLGNRFEASVEQRIGLGEATDVGGETSTSASIGTALVFADGHFAMSRPVYDSFAMFEPNKAIRQFALAADPQGGFASSEYNYSAKSSAFGAAVVPDLSSYLVRSIQVAAPDAPAGVSIGGDAFNLLPTYKSGFHFTVGSAGNVALIGRIVDLKGEPVPLAAGFAIMKRDAGEVKTPVFTNASGRFYLDGVESGEQVRIVFESIDAQADIAAPENAIGLVRFEQPVVVMPAATFDGRVQTPADPASTEK